MLTTEDRTDILGFIHPLYDLTLESPDVAILGVKAEADTIKWAALLPTKEAKALNTGDEIATLGFPGELEQEVSRFTERIPTLKTGIISALRPYREGTTSHRITNRVVQHNFDTTPGTSGSPVLNIRGEVIAIHYSGLGQGSLGFAIRADELGEMIEAIEFEFGSNPANSRAAPRSPSVGVMLQTLDKRVGRH